MNRPSTRQLPTNWFPGDVSISTMHQKSIQLEVPSDFSQPMFQEYFYIVLNRQPRGFLEREFCVFAVGGLKSTPEWGLKPAGDKELQAGFRRPFFSRLGFSGAAFLGGCRLERRGTLSDSVANRRRPRPYTFSGSLETLHTTRSPRPTGI